MTFGSMQLRMGNDSSTSFRADWIYCGQGGQQLERLLFPRIGRERFDVAHYFDHGGAAARNGAVQGGAQLGRLCDANSQRAHTFRDRGEVDFREMPHLALLL